MLLVFTFIHTVISNGQYSISTQTYDCPLTCQSCVGQNQCSQCKTADRDQTNMCVCKAIKGSYSFDGSDECSTCSDPNCVECYYPSWCTLCDSNLQMTLDLDTLTCICQQGYFLLNGICQVCDQTCLICNGLTKSDCTSCGESSQRYLQGSSCKCLSGLFEDAESYICKQCISTCLTCDFYYNTCTSCSEAQFRILSNDKCVCTQGYYEIQNQDSCQKCHPSCLDCNNQSSCLTCDLLVFRTFIKDWCYCIQGYGESLTLFGICELCHPSCETCIKAQSQDWCLTCKPPNQMVSGSCVAQCHYSCKTCSDYFNNQACLTCPTNRFKDPSNPNVCLCYEGTFDDGRGCWGCHYSCLGCFNGWAPQYCISCPPTRMLVNGQCLCSSPYQVNVYGEKPCFNCHYSCITCSSNTRTTCLTCDTTYRELSYGECLCKVGTFDPGIRQCNICNQDCHTCNGPTNNDCLSCRTNYTLYGSQCLCSDGYYFDDSIQDCQQCSYKCRTCVNATSCSDCASLSYRSMPQCDCTDPIFKVGLDGIYNCQQCNVNCLDCDGTSLTTCTQCDSDDNRVLNPQTSTCDCNTGYFDNGLGFCLNCSQYCESCINFFDNCITCSSLQHRILNGNTCICQDRYFETVDQDPICQECFGSCLTCSGSSSDQCLTCPIGVNRIQQGSQCNCLYGYYQTVSITCEQCQLPCITCINLLTCLSCDTTLNRYYDPFTNSCLCSDSFFEIGQLACSQCHYKCLTCSGDMFSCTSCPSNTNREYDPISKSCECKFGYFDKGQPLCQGCSHGCLGCIKQFECTSCPSTRYLSGIKCLCKAGFYDSTYKNCLPCSIQCQTCQDTASNCLTCPQTRYLQNGQCICSPGFREDGSQICQTCDQKCKTCGDSSNQCTSCDPYKFRVLFGQNCICFNGYYDNSVCLQCSSICKTCETQFDNCLSCDSSLYRYLSNNKCKCIDGFYDSGQADCLSCDYKCLTCENQQDNCLTCDNNKFRIFNQNQCPCADGYYDNGVQTSCQSCNQNCQICSGLSNFCTSCNATKNLVLSQNQCICAIGYFMDSNGICQICDKACYTCVNSPTSCTWCVYYRYLVMDQCYCIDGYYENNLRDCIQCGVTCLTCIGSSNNCQTCSDLSNRVKQGSQCNCRDGYVEDEVQICKPCSYQCKKCQLQSDQCTSCSQVPNVNRILSNNSCICIKGYYDNGTLICQPCGYSCKECSNAVYCTACNTLNTFRIDQSKVGTCPCLNGFYDLGQLICQACSYQCATCITSNQCKTCKIVANSYRINQPFQCPCQPGYFDDGQQITCQKCSPICATCQTQSTSCLTCKGQFVSGAPECLCIQSYYRDQKQICSPCDWQCLTCIDTPSNCSKCRGNRINKNCVCEQSLFEVNLELCMPCSHKCLTCVTKSEQCTQCRGDRINSPYCICQDGFYDDEVNQNCAKCDYTCATCNISGCLTCAGNRILEDIFCNPPNGSVSYSFTPWCSTCTVAVLNITFAQSLEQINIQFAFPINFATKQTATVEFCGSILNITSIQSFGQSPSCYLDQNNSQILVLKLGLQATINQDDTLFFIQNSLIVQNCTQQINLFINNFVQFPNSIFAPQLQIQSPSGKISPCQFVNINSGIQLYDGMRSLTNYQWIASVPQNHSADISKLRGLLNLITQKQITNLQIQPFMIPENIYVQINLTYMSFANIYNTTTINLFIGTKNTPLIYFNPEQMEVYSWQKVQLIINYANQKCDGNNTVKANTTLNINIHESSRLPQSSKQLQNYSQIQGTPDQSQIQIYIEQFSLSPNTVYFINVTGQDIEDTQSNSYSVLQLTVKHSSLLAQIIGGSRIQNYNANYDVVAQFKDPDDFYDYNKDPQIIYQMRCIDIQTNKNCQYANKTLIQLNETFIQHIIGGQQDSFTVQQWEIRVQKGLRTSTSVSLIILVDYQFPQVSIDYPSGYQARQISLNEELYFKIKSDEENTLFSFALIYNYKQVAVSNMISNQIKFQMWDYFEQFINGDKITIKFQAQGLKTILPGIADCILDVKQPPVGAQFIVNPTYGTSFSTIFSMTILQAYDNRLPLYYRFILFDSQQDYLTFNMSNSIVLCDFQQSGYINQILYTNQNQIIAGQVRNALGSTKNLTLVLNISSSNYTCDNFSSKLNQQNYVSVILQLKELINQNLSCIDKVWQIQQQVQSIINIEKDHFQQYLCQKILQLTSNYLIQFKINSQNNRFLQQNQLNKSQIKEQLKQIQIHSNYLISQGYQYSQVMIESINFGDPITQNLQQINFYQRVDIYNLIDLLQLVIYQENIHYDNIFKDFQMMIQIIQNISESLQINQLPNQNKIRFIGNQIRSNIVKVDKRNFNKLISYQPENFVENDGLDDAMKEIVIQFLVYKFKNNFYRFKDQFIQTIKLNSNFTKNDIIQYEMPILLNQSLYVMNLYYLFAGNNKTINFINYGYLTYYMGQLNQILNSSQYSLRCYQLWDNIWLHDKCSIVYSNNFNQTDIFCQCQYTNPVTMIGIQINYEKQANVTIVRSFLSKQQEIYELYLFWVSAVQLILILPFIIYFRKSINSGTSRSVHQTHQLDSPKNEIHYTFEQFGSSVNIFTSVQTYKNCTINEMHSSKEIVIPEISKQHTSIDAKFIKTWFWAVFEITAILKSYDKQIKPYQKFLLLELNMSFTFELTILLFYVFPYISIIPFVLSLTILFNFFTKILESLLTTQAFKQITYLLILAIWGAQFLVLIFPGTYIPKDYNQDLIEVYLMSIILQYSIIEAIIVLIKMNGLLAIKKILKEDPMNPILHVAYFIFFNETLDQEFNDILK